MSLARDSQRTASVIRERLSGDTWRIIVELCKQLEDGGGPLDEPEILERADVALQEIASISGLAQENMNRVAGWRFLEIGRRLERAVNTCRFIRQFGMEQARATDFDVLLDLIDSQITYRSRYLVGVAPYPVRDMALLDPYNPRSVAFQTQRLKEHIATLPVLRQDGMLEPPNRIAIELNADLATKVAACITACAHHANPFTRCMRARFCRASYLSKAASIPRNTASSGIPASRHISISAQSSVESSKIVPRLC